jgi:PAS domain S-box-containing protein
MPPATGALREVAARWTAVLRAGDVLCRAGGDEFLLLLVSGGFDGASSVVERLRERTPQPLSCSAGIARWDGRQSLQELVKTADAALYAAKATGRDRTVLASQETEKAAKQRRLANSRVPRAGEMRLDSGSGGGYSFDALVSDAGLLRLTAREDHFVSVSSNCTRVLGWQPEQLLALTFTEVVHPDDLRAALAEAGKVDEAGTEVDGFEARIRCADGSYRLLRFHAATDGNLWHAVAYDVTAHDRAAPRVAGDTRG